MWSLSYEQDGPLMLSQTLVPNVYTATPTCAAISEGVACMGDADGKHTVVDTNYLVKYFHVISCIACALIEKSCFSSTLNHTHNIVPI